MPTHHGRGDRRCRCRPDCCVKWRLKPHGLVAHRKPSGGKSRHLPPPEEPERELHPGDDLEGPRGDFDPPAGNLRAGRILGGDHLVPNQRRQQMNAEMLAKVRHEAGFIAALDQSGGSTPKALRLYGISDDCLLDRSRDVRPGPCDADPHHHQPQLRWQPHPRRHPLRDDHGPRHRRHGLGRVPVEGQAGRALPEGRPGPRRRGRRRSGDEAHARPRCPAAAGRRQGRLRHQDALGHQAGQLRPA